MQAHGKAPKGVKNWQHLAAFGSGLAAEDDLA